MKKNEMAKYYGLLFFLSLCFTSQSQNTSEKIIWPSKYDPTKSRFYVHNEIEIKARPKVVWAILIDALKWESWYEGARNISLIDSTSKVLRTNSIFNWQTMGLRFTSTVKEYQPNRILAWESVKKQIQGYHVWLIVPTTNGCKVITDESQNGWLTFFEKTFQGKKLKRLHDVWLKGLKKRAENTNS